eukprot:c35179_g1_i1 orf=3-200(-)
MLLCKRRFPTTFLFSSMEEFRQPKFSQASEWLPSWLLPLGVDNVNATPQFATSSLKEFEDSLVGSG